MLSVSSIAALPGRRSRGAFAERLARARLRCQYRLVDPHRSRTGRVLSELSLSFGRRRGDVPPRPAGLLDGRASTAAAGALELDGWRASLDLGAGTGRRSTEELGRRFAEVVAVEPDRCGCALPGAALAWQRRRRSRCDDQSVDAVFVGEAFHWFDPASAIGELARVLRPRRWAGDLLDDTGGRPSTAAARELRWSCSVSRTALRGRSANPAMPGATGSTTLPSSRCATRAHERRCHGGA